MGEAFDDVSSVCALTALFVMSCLGRMDGWLMVTKTVHVDEDVHAAIVARAKCSGDSVNVVLRHLLGLPVRPRGFSAAVAAVESALRAATAEVTVYEVAEAAKVGRSTAASALALLEREQLASRRPGRMGRHGRSRDLWRPANVSRPGRALA